MENEFEVVTLVDEDGQKENFAHVLTFNYEGQKYAALTPVEESDDDEAEIVLLRIDKTPDGDGILFFYDSKTIAIILGVFAALLLGCAGLKRMLLERRCDCGQ